MASETVTIRGHIIDSLILPKVMDEVVEFGASFEIVDLQIGVTNEDTSFARLRVTTESDEQLARLLDRLQQHGANPETVEDAQLAVADTDGAFPPGFYSSTNLETEVRIAGKWMRVFTLRWTAASWLRETRLSLCLLRT